MVRFKDGDAERMAVTEQAHMGMGGHESIANGVWDQITDWGCKTLVDLLEAVNSIGETEQTRFIIDRMVLLGWWVETNTVD